MKIEFSTGYAAFEDYGLENEIRYIFERIMFRISCGHTSGAIIDHNGNKVGEWYL